MKLSKEIQDALNEQIRQELNSAYIYLSMSAHFDSISLDGMASWMKKQYHEEVGHGMKLYDFLLRRGGKVVLKEIPQPKSGWNSTKEVFQNALENEQKVTELINNLLNKAISLKDYATISFLQWFIDEQVEEEDTVRSILDKIILIGEDKTGLLLLDKELSSRQE